MSEDRTVIKKFPKLLHGGDYNPDQWLDSPEILEEDIRLMKQAHVNCVSLGIFSWAALEPEEGRYEMDWLEAIIGRLYENGIYTILATPTGAMPPWLTAAYPETLQTDENGVHRFPGDRHNFCPSSPVMCEKMRQINEQLSRRFGGNPGVIAWHLSNEYGGNGRQAACHCPHCQEAFRSWLKNRYSDLDALNHAWWTTFWSHIYTDWDQIHSPSPNGENVLHGLILDWKRFVSDQLLDFCKAEIKAVRKYSDLPVTTNMMGFYPPLNYFEWAKELDIISWDCYPDWHSREEEIDVAVRTAAEHSLMRSLRDAPFLLMESTPSLVNWKARNILKKPGMHALSSLQAVAHGSNSVQYFQWRKSRGSCEKFHGAVVDHKNGSDTRVFRDVAALGERLEQLSDRIYPTCNKAKVALVIDWENMWAVSGACAVDNHLQYMDLCMTYFKQLWVRGIDTDIIDMTRSLDNYRLVIAPVNYMYRGDYSERVRQYVKNGGCYVTTYWSGEVDDTDLCFLGSHPLRDVLGIRTEEIDAPAPHEKNHVVYGGIRYDVVGLCALVHAEEATVLAEYQDNFYAGYPALTEHAYGAGTAYYIASQNEEAFLDVFYDRILQRAGVSSDFAGVLPRGVTITKREQEGREPLWFLQNFNNRKAEVPIREPYTDLETGTWYQERIEMEPFSCRILSREPEMALVLNQSVD